VVTSLLEVKLLCVGVNLIGVESFVHLLPSATFGNVLFTLLLASCLWSSDIYLGRAIPAQLLVNAACLLSF
jgi:hypothetical protein